MNATPTAPPEVVEFLRRQPPFDALDPAEVERVAAQAEVEFHRAGTTIFHQGADPVAYLRVIRRGAVEVVHDGRVLDLLGDGELFGHASMLSGLPTGFEARAAEDTLCYRIEADAASELLSAPAGLRFVARSLLDWPDEGVALLGAPPEPREDPAALPVGPLLRGAPIICTPETTIREAAQRMAAADASAVVIALADGTLGILTDHDLRERVLADGLGGDARVFEAMSAPAYTCAPDRLAGELLLEMLDRGFRHFPVVSATGEVLGVIEDRDLVAIHAHSSFFLRRRITRATTVADLTAVGRDLPAMVIAMDDARLAAPAILAVRAVVVDALTRRLLELSVEQLGRPATPFAWLALGSQARREAAPSADVDSAIVWFGDDHDPELQRRLVELGRHVVDGLQQCGLEPDEHGATASGELFVRSLASWQRAARGLDRRPDPGEGPDPRVGAGRQPSGVGDPRRDAGVRRVPACTSQPRAAAAAGPVRALLPAANRVLPRPRRRARRRAPRPARSQARWRAPDRRPRPLGGDVGRRHERVDRRAPARRRRGWGAAGGRGADADRRVRTDQLAPGRVTRSTSSAPASRRTTTLIRRRSAR